MLSMIEFAKLRRGPRESIVTTSAGATLEQRSADAWRRRLPDGANDYCRCLLAAAPLKEAVTPLRVRQYGRPLGTPAPFFWP